MIVMTVLNCCESWTWLEILIGGLKYNLGKQGHTRGGGPASDSSVYLYLLKLTLQVAGICRTCIDV